MSSAIAPPGCELARELMAHWPQPWPLERWLSTGCAAVVKQGPNRTIYRVRLDGIDFFVKRHHVPDRKTWLRECLRPAKARREYRALQELRRRGIPAPEPLGWGMTSGRLGRESFLVTRALPEIVPLGQYLQERVLAAAERQLLARALGEFLARLHAAGVLHRDLHPGNLLVRREGEGHVFHLVDLDALRLESALDARHSEANLAMFGGWFRGAASRSDRLRFLAAYVAARGWLDVDADRRGAQELFRMARRIEAACHDYCLAFWRRRDRRCLESNRYYRPIQSAGHVGHAVRTLGPVWLDKLLRDPDGLFSGPGVRILKDSPSATVAIVPAEVDGCVRPVILKRFLVTRASDPWVALVRHTPALRSWVLGQALLERGLPTARPYAVLQRRKAGLVHEAYLVTELLEDVEGLDAYVRALSRLPATESRRRLLRQLERVARAVRELHAHQLSHRDLKAANLLVTSVAAEATPAGAARPIPAISIAPTPPRLTNLWFIDLVGVQRHERVGKRRRVRDLARLNVSFLNEPCVSRADRLRFLGLYLGWGVHGKGDWKAWWRAIAAATALKIARNQRSGRVLS